jgi:hypothetical protein
MRFFTLISNMKSELKNYFIIQFFLKKWKKDPDSDVLLVVNYIENECFEPKKHEQLVRRL